MRIAILAAVPLLIIALCSHQTVTRLINQTATFDNRVKYSIDEIDLQGAMFSCRGTLFMDGDSQWYGKKNKHIWLKDIDTGAQYQVSTRDVVRPELKAQIGDESLRNCGFICSADLGVLQNANATYEVLLTYQKAGRCYCVDTRYRISSYSLYYE